VVQKVFDTSSGFATFSPVEAEKASAFISVNPRLRFFAPSR
jgi:hypothetical protein